MYVMPVYLSVPTAIQQGLASGALTRNAAGIVRATSLHPFRPPGSIVGHLREVNGSAQASDPSAFLSATATVVLQAATLAYMKVRLDRIEDQITGLHQQGVELMSQVSHVKDMQYLQFVQPVAEAMELLQRCSGGNRNAHLDDAHVGFVKATGALRLVFSRHSSERMLENAGAMEAMFNAASVCAAGELQCLALRGAPVDERTAALRGHAALWGSVQETLAAPFRTSTRFPTGAMLRAVPGGVVNKTRARWHDAARETGLALQSERDVMMALKARPVDELNAWVASANEGAHKVLFVDAGGALRSPEAL